MGRLGHVPQQLMLQVPEIIQQVRTEMSETVSGRVDVLNSSIIVFAKLKPAPARPERIIDLIPRNRGGSNDKGEFRHVMSDLHLWIQAWSNERQTMLVSVERTDKFNNSALSADCSQDQFRTIEASLYLVLHRTIANEPLRTVQQ